LVLIAALRPGAVLVQTGQDCLITIAPDGTCQFSNVHVPCSEIGPKLRDAGISPNVWIRFSGAGVSSYDLIRITAHSLDGAGYQHMKIGFITEPVR